LLVRVTEGVRDARTEIRSVIPGWSIHSFLHRGPLRLLLYGPPDFSLASKTIRTRSSPNTRNQCRDIECVDIFVCPSVTSLTAWRSI